MKWLRKKKNGAVRADEFDDGVAYEDKLTSRMRAIQSVSFDDAEEVEARIRRMSYGARVEHRPAWMEVDEWEDRNSA